MKIQTSRYSTIFGTILLLSLLILSPVQAGSLAGVDFPDQVPVGGKDLVLNGIGLRTATVLKVKVYVMGLYLEDRSSDASAIITSGQNKRIDMRFVHKVTAKELRGGWTEGFEDNYKDVGSIRAEIEKFNASMRDVSDGDSIVLDFAGDAVDVFINGKKIDSVKGNTFQQAVLSIWLGPEPPNQGLKKGILGK